MVGRDIVDLDICQVNKEVREKRRFCNLVTVSLPCLVRSKPWVRYVTSLEATVSSLYNTYIKRRHRQQR